MKGQAKLRPIYQGLLIFCFVFIMYTSAHIDINERYGIENNATISVQSEYEDLQNNVKSDDPDNKGLLEKLKTLSDPLNDPFATIGAGLYIVPQTVGVLTGPLDIASGMLGTIGSALNWLIPVEITNFIFIVLAVAITFSILEIALRIREA